MDWEPLSVITDVDVDNILLGYAMLYVFNEISEWESLGYTFGGVKILTERDYVTRDRADSFSPDEAQKIGERTYIDVVMAELDVGRLARVFDRQIMRPASKTDVLNMGDYPHSQLNAIKVIGYGPAGYKRTMNFHKVLNRSSGSYNQMKETASSIPVRLQVFSDMSKSAGERLYSIQDEAI